MNEHWSLKSTVKYTMGHKTEGHFITKQMDSMLKKLVKVIEDKERPIGHEHKGTLQFPNSP